MRVSEIGVDDDSVELVFLAFLAFGFVFRRVARDVGEEFAVRRPSERLYVVIFIRQLVGLAAVYGDDPDLNPFVAVREERDVRAVRRPLRRSLTLVTGSQFRRRPAVGRDQPDVRNTAVLLLVPLRDRISDAFAV